MIGNDVDISKCKTYSGESTKTTVCYCKGDYCNGSDSSHLSLPMAKLVAIIGAMKLFNLHAMM